MASRREQKEALRREREERERRAREAEQRKRLVGYGVGAALVLAALAVVSILLLGGGGGGQARAAVLPDGGQVPAQRLTSLSKAASAAGCRLTSQRASSREHTRSPDERVRYATDPPSSGRHYLEPAPDGAYPTAPSDERVVHSLEHGRVVVWFKPSLPAATRANLKALFDEHSFLELLVPRARMPYAVAASAWTRDPEPLGTGHLLTCPRFHRATFDALRAFSAEYRGKGPETVP
ncbi:MAG: DUF3105 domain-containing protein [Nocardioidaceae bacterium]